VVLDSGGSAEVALLWRRKREESVFAPGEGTADVLFCRVGVVGGVARSRDGFDVKIFGAVKTEGTGERPGKVGGVDRPVRREGEMVDLRGANDLGESSVRVCGDGKEVLVARAWSDDDLVMLDEGLEVVVVIVRVMEAQWFSIIACHFCTILVT
jgi:hypothetical protein